MSGSAAKACKHVGESMTSAQSRDLTTSSPTAARRAEECHTPFHVRVVAVLATKWPVLLLRSLTDGNVDAMRGQSKITHTRFRHSHTAQQFCRDVVPASSLNYHQPSFSVRCLPQRKALFA